jgi:hypothetical protein
MPIHFNEDGGEFNQIATNLAMVCATPTRGACSPRAPRGEFRNTGRLPARSH